MSSHRVMKMYGEWTNSSTCFKFRRKMEVVSFTLRLSYPRYSVSRRMGGGELVCTFWRREKSLPLQGVEPRSIRS